MGSLRHDGKGVYHTTITSDNTSHVGPYSIGTYGGMATTCTVYSGGAWGAAFRQADFIATDIIKRKGNWMTLYKVYMVDIRKSAVTSEHTRIGKDEADAGIGLVLTEEEEKLRAKDELAILWQCIGEFEKLKRSRVVVDKEE